MAGGYVACLLQTLFFGTYLEHNPLVRARYMTMARQVQLDPSLVRLAPAMSGLFISAAFAALVGGLSSAIARAAQAAGARRNGHESAA